MTCSWHSRNYITLFGWAATFSGPLMSLWPARDMSLGRWLLVACFSSLTNHNVSGLIFFQVSPPVVCAPIRSYGRGYGIVNRITRTYLLHWEGIRDFSYEKNLRVSANFFLRNAITSKRQFASQNHEFFVYFTISKGSVFRQTRCPTVTFPSSPLI